MLIPFPSFEALLASYFQDLRVRNWSEATIDRRKHSLGRFIDWLVAHSIESLNEVSAEMISAYQRSLFHQGNLRTRAPLSFATQASYLSAVSHWCQWACLKKFLSFNPSIGIELPKEEKRLPASYLSADEAERKCVTIVAFIASLIPAGVVLHASCYFALGTGLITDNRPNVVWLCRTLDQVYFELIDSTCNKKASSRYLQLLSWSFDRGMNLKMMGNEDTHKR